MNLFTVRELRELPPLIWLAVLAECLGAVRVRRVKSACHRQLTASSDNPTETLSREHGSNRRARMGNRAQAKEAAASQRGKGDQRIEPFMWWFHDSLLEIILSVFFFFYSSLSVSAYLLALPLCCSALQTTVISSTEILKIWGGENHLCIKVQKLNWFPKIYSSKVSNLQLRVFSPPLQTRWIFCPCSEWRAEQISTGD